MKFTGAEIGLNRWPPILISSDPETGVHPRDQSSVDKIRLQMLGKNSFNKKKKLLTFSCLFYGQIPHLLSAGMSFSNNTCHLLLHTYL